MSTYPCPQCGTLLAPGETVCKTCGRRSIEPTQYASPSYLSSSMSGSSTVEPTQYASPSYPGYASPGSSTVEPTQYASPASASPYESGSQSASNLYASSPYETASSSAAPPPPPTLPYATPLPYAQPVQPKKGPNIGLLIGVGVLLLVLIGGGVLLFAGGKKAPTQGATSSSTATSTKNATAATGTASAAQPLFADTFADNSKGWTLGNGATISDHALTLATTGKNASVNEFLPVNNPFGDFLLKVTYTVEQGDQNDVVGLSLRTDSNFNHEYHINLDVANQTFEIGKEYVDSSNKLQEKVLVPVTTSSALNPVGQQNTIAVVMKGNHLVLSINGKVVESVSDSDYSSGQIAIYAIHGNTSDGVKASFTNVSIYPAPDQLPS
jgi:3-keto-disaccharide hydrolase